MKNSDYSVHTRVEECFRRFSDLCLVEAREGQLWAEDHKARFHAWAASLGLAPSGIPYSDEDLSDNGVKVQVIAQLLSALGANLSYLTALYLKLGKQSSHLSTDQKFVDYTKTPSSSSTAHEKDLIGAEVIDLSNSRHDVEAGLKRLSLMTRAIRLSSKRKQTENGEHFVDRDKYGNNVASFYSRLARIILDYKHPHTSEVIQIRLAKSMSQRRNRFAYLRRSQMPPLEENFQISSTKLVPKTSAATTSFGTSELELELELGVSRHMPTFPHQSLSQGRRDSIMSLSRGNAVSQTSKAHRMPSVMRSHSEVSAASDTSFATRRIQKHSEPRRTDQKFRLSLQTLSPTPTVAPPAFEDTSSDSARKTDISTVKPKSDPLLEAPCSTSPVTRDFSEESENEFIKTPVVIGGDKFHCPYCLQLRPVQEASGIYWRRHVIADLKPYVCLYEKCQESGDSPRGIKGDSAKSVIQTFSTFEAWITHMRQHPITSEWICAASVHKPISFNESKLFEEHMREVHAGTFAASELPDLARMSMRPISSMFGHCPLCENLPEDGDKVPLSAVGQNALLKHVASHLKDLAFLSVQWLQNDKEGNQNDDASFTAKPSMSNSSITTRSGAIDDFNHDLTFQDPPQHQESREEDYDTYTADSILHTESQIPDPGWVTQTKFLDEDYVPTFEEEWGSQKSLEPIPAGLRFQISPPIGKLQGEPSKDFRVPTFLAKPVSQTGPINGDMTTTQTNTHEQIEGSMSPSEGRESLQQLLRRQEESKSQRILPRPFFQTRKERKPAQAADGLERILRASREDITPGPPP